MNAKPNASPKSTFLSFIFIFLLGVLNISAQELIEGKIVDEGNIPVPGVNILIQDTTNGVVSDFDGNFSITASPNDILIVSYLGYETQSILVEDQKSITIELIADSEELEDVIVVGYGSAKRKDLSGSFSTLKSKSFENQPLSRPEEALQGRVSGVSIQKSSGIPGSQIKVRVRGVNSVTGNNAPLVVIDGVFGGNLQSLNPADIESINVLKDASALAIYGSRGSNGVILVTTKRGKGKTKVSVETFTTISEVSRSIDRLNSEQFAHFKNEERINNGNAPIFSDAEVTNFATNPIDYEDAILRDAFGTNTQLSISGGSDDFNYFLSGNYVNQDGVVITNDYERYSLRSNIKTNISDRLSLGVNIFGSRETDINNPNSFDRVTGSLLTRAITYDPTTPIHSGNEGINDGFNIESLNSFANNRPNPIAALNRSKREFITDRLNANIDFKYKITDRFTYNLIVGLATINNTLQSFIIDGDNSTPDAVGHTTVNFNNTRVTNHQVSNIFNYKNNFGSHALDATAVYEFQGSRSESNSYSTADVTIPGFFVGGDEGNPDDQRFTNGGGQTAIQSFLGRITYSYDNSLYLTTSLRVDQSSRFLEDNRTGYFPSISLAYGFDKLIEDSKFDNLKLRVSWGEVGSQFISPLANQAGVLNVFPAVTFDGVTAVIGNRFSRAANPNITWETTEQWNAGVDVGVLNRVSLSLDYFIKNTRDLLLVSQLPNSNINFSSNVGEVKNQGFDITLSGDIIQNDDFIWNSSLALSYVENEVIALNDGQEQIVGNIQSIDGTTNPINVIREGLPLGQFYGFVFLGTWKSTDNIPTRPNGTPLFRPGDARYLLDENNRPMLQPLGSGIPKTTWGLNNTITYKNWDLNIFIQGAHGFKVFNLVEGAINGQRGAFRDNLSFNALNAWTSENETDVPRLGSNTLLNSSQFVEDGDYIRLSNLTIGYTIKDLFGARTKFYIGGQNLAIITDYSGYDPEVTSTPGNPSSANVDVASGINIGAIPTPRSYTLGVKFDF
ncbi:SusC/RagA family TonB-linked outer membrane protein [Aquimarina algicola]|uniref:TonB-dependent receptor n=1 Tax=Aquimarina algicola TaxID=2589995 RepID=A0A504JBX0_9FLAO|nr:TonB-dependent receptor [Aquimarina algicola]TPN84419.1 TonB-dependent receptor [Aquimarina algicola]